MTAVDIPALALEQNKDDPTSDLTAPSNHIIDMDASDSQPTESLDSQPSSEVSSSTDIQPSVTETVIAIPDDQALSKKRRFSQVKNGLEELNELDLSALPAIPSSNQSTISRAKEALSKRLARAPKRTRFDLQQAAMAIRKSDLSKAGPKKKLDDGWGTLEILSVDLICKSHQANPQGWSGWSMRKGAEVGSSVTVGYATYWHSKFAHLFVHHLIYQGSAPLVRTLSTQLGYIGLAIGLGYVAFKQAQKWLESGLEISQYNWCLDIYKRLCQTEKLAVGSGDDVPTMKNKYISHVLDKYHVSLDNYVDGFWALLNEKEVPEYRLVSNLKEMKQIYRDHPQTAYGFALYYTTVMYKATIGDKEAKPIRSRFVAFLSEFIKDGEDAAGFKNMLQSLYVALVTCYADKALVVAIKNLLKDTLHKLEYDPARSKLVKYFILAWSDVENSIKDLVNQFCEENPEFCKSMRQGAAP